jgi:hypothetical protein
MYFVLEFKNDRVQHWLRLGIFFRIFWNIWIWILEALKKENLKRAHWSPSSILSFREIARYLKFCDEQSSENFPL